ncbi:hypothetical protein ACFCXC_18365 [Streptomyces microflavus]|uniref:hypothetical protein n=1 Tax=Streptomyces microflavus TaxID=1919 RepID=UPI0035E1809A
MTFDLGSTVRLAADCRNPGGTLTTAESATAAVTLPDGSLTLPATAETAPGTGRYQADFVTTLPGRHTVRWTFTGPADAYTDSFDVRDASPPTILSLAQARAHLKLPANQTDRDDEIRDWTESITRGIEGMCGPVIVRTVSERHQERSARTIVLGSTPVIELVSVTTIGQSPITYAVDGLDLDPGTGLVRRLDGGGFTGPSLWVYRAGRPIVTANIRSAAKIILQHLWRTSQGPSRPQLGGSDFDVSEPIVGFGYAIPNRALQLLEPDRLPPEVG